MVPRVVAVSIENVLRAGGSSRSWAFTHQLHWGKAWISARKDIALVIKWAPLWVCQRWVGAHGWPSAGMRLPSLKRQTPLFSEPANSLQRQNKDVPGFVSHFLLFIKPMCNSCNWRWWLGDPCGFDGFWLREVMEVRVHGETSSLWGGCHRFTAGRRAAGTLLPSAGHGLGFPTAWQCSWAAVVLDQQPLSTVAQHLMGWHNISKNSAKQEGLPLEF